MEQAALWIRSSKHYAACFFEQCPCRVMPSPAMRSISLERPDIQPQGARGSSTVNVVTWAGGFQPLAFNEDVALVDALIATGASIGWINQVRVFTSARLDSRTPWGFGATLKAASLRLSGGVPFEIAS
ncbi:hypothetical protein AWB80_08313 [Caballeronia pedi]|uniref:Uncharacterized protein n=1 Tax=Caballeronia pedi TaxID=1777141 RepID=A0A158E5X4_9BURK|nr:hypothetical protein AWB80_08313 [Caballeronia pedi]